MKDKKIAIINFEGTITTKNIDIYKFSDCLEKAFDWGDEVVLIMNSPGGNPSISESIHKEISRLTKVYKKKILCFAQSYCCSGGYYIASACYKIYTTKSSLIGSVGVIASGFGFNKLIKKLGIERRVFTAGNNKSRLDSFLELKEEDREWMNSLAEDLHESFIEDVKKHRDIEDEDLNGDVFTNQEAVNKGFSDGIKYYLDYTAEAKLKVFKFQKKTLSQKIFSSIQKRLTESMFELN